MTYLFYFHMKSLLIVSQKMARVASDMCSLTTMCCARHTAEYTAKQIMHHLTVWALLFSTPWVNLWSCQLANSKANQPVETADTTVYMVYHDRMVLQASCRQSKTLSLELSKR